MFAFRPFFDFPCEFELNKPYSEPLFGALNQTKNVSFLNCCADQLYRLQEGVNEPPGELWPQPWPHPCMNSTVS